MNRQRHLMLALASTVLLVGGALAAEQSTPATPKPTGTAGQAAPAAPAAPAKMVPPIRGVANIGYTKPVTKAERVGDKQFIITTIMVKNMSTGSIAGLKVDEFWYDKGGNPVTGGNFRSRKPLAPNEVITVELRVPRDPKMATNSYNFSHANGTIVPKLMPKL